MKFGPKHRLTRIICKTLNLTFSSKNFVKRNKMVWHNPRNGGFRLTKFGFEALKNDVELECFYIQFPKDTILSNYTILQADRTITAPYFYDDNGIHVFSEIFAVQLILFGGDLNEFIKVSTVNKYKK